MSVKARYENGVLVLPKPGLGRPMKEIYQIGKKYGCLTVLERLPDPKGYIRLRCRCDCGQEKLILWSNLQRGKTKSCGFGDCRPAWNPDRIRRTYNTLLSQYQWGAKNRNLPWELDYEEFLGMVRSNCYYCGNPPSRAIASKMGKKQAKWNWDTILYNGIDRLDSDFGYFKENCVPCCYFCNRAKWEHPHDTFLAWIKRVYEHSFSSKILSELS